MAMASPSRASHKYVPLLIKRKCSAHIKILRTELSSIKGRSQNENGSLSETIARGQNAGK